MIRHVLQDNRLNYEKSKFYDVMRAILGNGIFLAEGDEWLSQRRSAARSFQGCQLRRLPAAMQEAVGDLPRRRTPTPAPGPGRALLTGMTRPPPDLHRRNLVSRRRHHEPADILESLTELLRHAQRGVRPATPH